MEVKVSLRNTKLDSLKTILIFCVVLGHVIQPRGDGMVNEVNMLVKTFIFSFHMPLFILLSVFFVIFLALNLLWQKGVLNLCYFFSVPSY